MSLDCSDLIQFFKETSTVAIIAAPVLAEKKSKNTYGLLMPAVQMLFLLFTCVAKVDLNCPRFDGKATSLCTKILLHLCMNQSVSFVNLCVFRINVCIFI